ncbi:MAG TPA: c-type cytochrome [Aggregatilinea sp.]|uniref:c-type cytochrome n=1 Tax=Aggregatilinea sp. TaxID=2806333 RepID=UPI002B8E436A|nr:c-type cytochrome [Aggregatilinea sp.]HML23916.1 c-type cytochrome [Aggregatilinea sp.]
MKRVMLVLALLAALVVPARAALAQGGEEQDDQEAPYRGAAVYAEFCQACHGDQGQGRGEGPAFRAITFDPETAHDIIADGLDRDSTDGAAMPPFAQLSGGLLTARQIDDLLAYMATWGTGQTPPLPAPNLDAVIADYVPDEGGRLDAGAEIYATSCYGCHGRSGLGRVPPNFPPLTVSNNTLALTRDGTNNPFMPAFGAEHGGPLDDAALDDLNAYLASWTVAEPLEDPSSEGYGTLLILMGIAALLVVGGVTMAREMDV